MAYCANDPFNLTDLDGDRIRFANGASAQFMQNFSEAIQYLNSKNASAIVAALEKLPQTVYIAEFIESEKMRSPCFINAECTIYWSPYKGMQTTKNGSDNACLSPATILIHEMDHALDYITNRQRHEYNYKTPDGDFDNLEEKRVIEGSERQTAIALGEIKPENITSRPSKRARGHHIGIGREPTG